MGQTCRKFSSRISEHRRHINWNTDSIITEYRIEFSHDIDWENVQILDRKREIFEQKINFGNAIHTYAKECLNLRSDTEDLPYLCSDASKFFLTDFRNLFRFIVY